MRPSPARSRRCGAYAAWPSTSGRAVIEAARAGEAHAAIEALGRFRLLCAHRRGPEGVTAWMQHVESWLRADVEGFGFATGADWYVGRPLIVTENDYGLQLFNGDTGVVVAAGDERLVAAFERGDTIAQVSPTRLAAVDTVYAMTVHKSQGSQFHTVAFLLPGAGSRLLDPRAAVHGGDPGPGAADSDRHRGAHQGGGRTPDHPGLRFARSLWSA